MYYEFVEGNIEGYESEFDLLSKTPDFFKRTLERYKMDLGSVYKFMKGHFKSRWNIYEDLYVTSIERHIGYLEYIIQNHPHDYRKYLKRGAFMAEVDEIVKRHLPEERRFGTLTSKMPCHQS